MKNRTQPEKTQLPQIKLHPANSWDEYELLDSGDGQTLERFGPYTLIRPEPQAIWSPGLREEDWDNADVVMVPTSGEHGGYWRYNKQIDQPWVIKYHGLKMRDTSFQIPPYWCVPGTGQPVGLDQGANPGIRQSP